MNNDIFYQRTEEFYDQCRQKLLSTANQLYQECIKTAKTKGAEYSGADDKFANFNRLADIQEISRYSIWFTYFTKHHDSLVSFIRKINKGELVSEVDTSLSEPISGRIMDMIVYLFILKGMIDEDIEWEKLGKT